MPWMHEERMVKERDAKPAKAARPSRRSFAEAGRLRTRRRRETRVSRRLEHGLPEVSDERES